MSLEKATSPLPTHATLIGWVLRVGMAGCFIGHGAFGIITKAAWVPYFAVAGISEPWAWTLMPWIGWMDVCIGILTLLRPCRALFIWGATWAVWTALLRPLSGEPFWEAFERGGNYGVPLAMLAIVGAGGYWFRLDFVWPVPSVMTNDRLAWTLRLTTFTLLLGHAGLGLFSHKAGLARHYSALGVSDTATLVPLVGAFEFFLAGLVLLRPRSMLLFAVCGWKIATEALFPLAGAPFWEVIERFGSYAAPLALALLLAHSLSVPTTESARLTAPAGN